MLVCSFFAHTWLSTHRQVALAWLYFVCIVASEDITCWKCPWLLESLWCWKVIVEQSEQGDNDYVKHALSLFLDFVQIFIRLLVILNDKEGRKKRNDDD